MNIMHRLIYRASVTPAGCVLTLLLCVPGVQAQVPEGPHVIGSSIQQYCSGCHGPQTQTAGMDLIALVGDLPLVKNRETWGRVMEVLEERRMPPPAAPQPTEEVRMEMLAILIRDIDEFDYSTIDDPGFEPMRRLTHDEYDNTTRDLFGVELDLAGRFPDELIGSSGFENSSNTLFLQPSLMERYIAVAERAVAMALPEVATTDSHRVARARTLLPGREQGVSDAEATSQILAQFLRRAYRRPPDAAELRRALVQYDAGRSGGLAHEAAVKQVIQGVLISPKFLLRVEGGQTGGDPYPVTDWELASRLSYFLWASMPDEELFGLAEAGTLREPAVLEAQVQRMLADPRAETLGELFAAQWLGFQHVGTRIWLDPIDNPWCTASLMTAMREETSMFFMSLVRGDRPIRTLLDADYTYVNEELARTLYGRDDVFGDEMRRVSIEDPNRGGLLGQASILALTSNYKDTSPVKRGHYVLDTLLGTPPPPPPPNAGILNEDVADLRGLSFREKLEMHSKNETCRVCHSKIDPIGFSLENFDYFGRWRDDYRFRVRVDGPDEANETVQIDTETSPDPVFRYYKNTSRSIVAAGALPDGTSFVGPAALKQALLETRYDDVVRQVVSKMLSYALGRQLDYYDEPALRRIIVRLRENDDRFGTLVQAIVESYPFQYKKAPTEETN